MGARPRSRFWLPRRGQAVVEFAILVPVLLLLLLIAVDAGRLFFTYIEVNNAAREAAAYGAGNPTDTGGMTQHATQETNAQAQRGESAVTLTAACADTSGGALACSDAAGGGGSGNTVTVSVGERFSFFTPLVNAFFSDDLTLHASATAAVLGFAATGGDDPGGCSPPTVASFAAGTASLTVSVDASASRSDSGLCAISGYNWDWGDGLDVFPPVIGKTATYTYATAGTYTITLDVTNQGGDLATTRTVTVGSPAPTPTPTPTPPPTPAPTPTPTAPPVCTVVPDFAFTLDGGKKVTFTGSYTGQPVPASWSWNFGDGDTATGQNPPQHAYGSASTKTVTMTITTSVSGCGPKSVSKQVKP